MASFKMYYTAYDLEPSSNRGKGFLLRFDHGTNDSFFSSVQSWENLDRSNVRHLENDIIDCRLDNVLLDCAFQMARHSKKVFSEKEFRTKIPSHLLVSQFDDFNDLFIADLVESSYQSIKVKIHKDLNLRLLDLFYWAGELDPKIELRLDFNLHFPEDEVFKCLAKLTPEELARIDFIEDPFSSKMDSWVSLFKHYNIKAGLDWFRPVDLVEEHWGAVIPVFKPAFSTRLDRLYLDQLKKWNKIKPMTCVFTSYMAHPIEQLLASCEAETLIGQIDDIKGGFCSHNAYDKNSYSELFNVEKAQLGLPDTKIFLDRLENEEWKYAGSFG